jgi:hypothetical protein
MAGDLLPPGFGWLLLAAALLHVGEDYRFGWIAWAGRFVPGITRAQFLAWNGAFLLLCLLGLLPGPGVFRLSLAGLVLLNALVHLVPSLIQRRYSPGLGTALLLYVPLGAWAYGYACRRAQARPVALSLALGAFWMALPFLFQALRRRPSGI